MQSATDYDSGARRCFSQSAADGAGNTRGYPGRSRSSCEGNRRRLVLGIETSCDDTGAAVVDELGNVIGDALNSQTKTHVEYVQIDFHFSCFIAGRPQ